MEQVLSKIIQQDPDAVLMVRPAHFGFNVNTAKTNAFQQQIASINEEEIAKMAISEFDGLVSVLEENKVGVLVAQDTTEYFTPDAVFPNNWITFHENGKVVLYPMLAPERRLERKLDVFKYLSKEYSIDAEVIDLSPFEEDEKYLEGTGSLILDRVNKRAFACISQRTDQYVLREFEKQTGYKVVAFNAVDDNGLPVYHTNVILSICQHFVVVCLDVIKDKAQQDLVEKELSVGGRELIKISLEQVKNFCGNVLGLRNSSGESLVVMSTTAYEAFSTAQKQQIKKHAELIHSSIPTIERVGGGSVRCMLAAIHLPKTTERG